MDLKETRVLGEGVLTSIRVTISIAVVLVSIATTSNK